MKFFYSLGNLFGKNQDSDPDDAEPEETVQPTWIGRIVKTITPLRTCGYIEIDGEKVEVMSVHGFVPQQSYVRIIGTRMGRWIVEPVESPRVNHRK